VPPVTNLSAPDLEGVLGLVAEAASADGETPFEKPLIDRLAKLVPADHAGYYEYECGGRNVYFVDTPTALWASDAVGCDEWASMLHNWPLHDAHLHGLRTAVKFSDFVSERAKGRHPWYAEQMRPCAQEHECKLLLPDPAPDLRCNARGFFFTREPGRKDFDERDRAVLTVLRTQLAAIRDRWERSRSPVGLTTRQAEIAHLLRAGLTNEEIADQLVISTGTVRTHLENIFEKLGVHTRTAAVARAFASVQPPEA
jgi:DNA-binding CsgD family transcriptional regulator